MLAPPVTATADAIERLRAKHLEYPAYGAGGLKFHKLVKAFCLEIGAASALDYCCGKGVLVDALLRDRTLQWAHKFDLGIKAFSEPCPRPVDLAICNHALYEFAPEAFHDGLNYLGRMATKAVFISFQWGDTKASGASHWYGTMQDADWVYLTMRHHWPAHRLLDTGPTRSFRQMVFYGFNKAPSWP